MRIAALSDVGLVRSSNEDAYWIDVDRGLAILADGMGGHNAGEVAANLAVKVIADRLSLAIDEGCANEQLVNAMQEAFTVASEEVYSLAQESPKFIGMGCSLITGVVREGDCYVAHVGDTRAYLFHQETLSQMTIDDTPVAALVKRGYLLPEKARSHTLKNFLIKTLGTKPDIDANVSRFPVKSKEKLLLCSDGLWGLVDHNQIRSTLCDHNELELCCRQLVHQAREKGGRDNITVILIEIDEAAKSRGPDTAKIPRPVM